MEKYKEKYHDIEKNQKIFEKILETITETKKTKEKLFWAELALNYATYNNAGYFISSFLETFYTNYAKTIDIENYNISYKPNSFLHVLTKGYEKGGHTRVIERWIDNSSKEQTHSVVVIKPNENKLNKLKALVKEKNGDFVFFENNLSLQERALKLRALGLNYQYIILHTHMDDPTATVAFGTEKFTRPVLFYNHASHMFWIGKSVSDIVLDLIENDRITAINRNIKNTFFLGIPMKNIEFKTVDKMSLRKKLGFPCDKKIIISAGSDFKYNPICNDNFVDLALKIIDKDTYLYVIGAEKKREFWKNAYKESNGHIIALGYINFKDGYLDYISTADLYLDSYPCNGWTATIDAISLGIPAISISTSLDFLKNTKSVCDTKEEFIEKAKKILNDTDYAKEIVQETQKSLVENLSKESWNRRIENLLSVIPKTHTVKALSKETDYKKIEDISVLCNILMSKKLFHFKGTKFNKYSLKYSYIIKKFLADLYCFVSKIIRTKNLWKI